MRSSSPPSSRWARVALLLPTQFAWLAFAAAGLVLIAKGQVALGIVFLTVAAVTAFLAIRRARAAFRSGPAETLLEGQGPTFDYIVWVFVGLPFILLGLGLLAALLGLLK